MESRGYHQSPKERYNQPIYDFLSCRLLGLCVKEKKMTTTVKWPENAWFSPLYFSCLISHFFYKKGGEYKQGEKSDSLIWRLIQTKNGKFTCLGEQWLLPSHTSHLWNNPRHSVQQPFLRNHEEARPASWQSHLGDIMLLSEYSAAKVSSRILD